MPWVGAQPILGDGVEELELCGELLSRGQSRLAIPELRGSPGDPPRVPASPAPCSTRELCPWGDAPRARCSTEPATQPAGRARVALVW